MPVLPFGYVDGLKELTLPSNGKPDRLRNRHLNPNSRSIFIVGGCHPHHPNLFSSFKILMDQGFSWSCPLPNLIQSRCGYLDSDLEIIALTYALRYLYLLSAGVRSRTMSSISWSSRSVAGSDRINVSYSFGAIFLPLFNL